MPVRPRPSRFTPFAFFILLALVSGLALTAAAGASSPRLGFIDSVGEFFGFQQTTARTTEPVPSIPPASNILAPAGTTYTWTPIITADYQIAANWSPLRTVPAPTDILVFNNGANTTVTNVPTTQTIAQLSVSGNTTVNLQAAAAATLTIGGDTGTDLSVASGSQLNCNTTNAITIAVATGATGSISGSMTFSAGSSAVHQLTAVDASGITFNSGSTFTQGTNSTGNVFGSSGTANTIVFASGAIFDQKDGSNPFALVQPSSKVVFQTGSLFRITASGVTPTFNGRTYANFQYNPGGANTQSPTGASTVSIDDLTVTTGTLNVGMTGTFNLKGNVSVASSQTLNFNSASAATINLNGTSAQTISGAGTLTFGANESIAVSNAAGVTLQRSIAPAANLSVTSGILDLSTFTADRGSAGGTLTVSNGATVKIGGTGTIPANYSTHSIGSTSTIQFNGSNQNWGALNSSQNYGNVIVSPSGTTTLTASVVVINALTINSGTLSQGASFDLAAGSVTVGGSGSWTNTGSGDVTLGGGVSNSGNITFNAGGGSCDVADSILIRSSVTNTQRAWTGTGTFNLTDVDVKDQAGTTVIVALSSTNSGNNGANWLFVNTCTSGTYTWTGAGGVTDWASPSAWSPFRTTPNSSDILIIDGSVTPGPTITNVPTETDAALRLINGVSGGATLSALSGGARMLTLNGGANALSVPSGSLLTLGGSTELDIDVASGSTGVVGGQIISQGGVHQLIGHAATAITFQSGSFFTTGTGFTGNPFGTGVSSGPVVFQNGSSAFIDIFSAPFGPRRVALSLPSSRSRTGSCAWCLSRARGFPKPARRWCGAAWRTRWGRSRCCSNR